MLTMVPSFLWDRKPRGGCGRRNALLPGGIAGQIFSLESRLLLQRRFWEYFSRITALPLLFPPHLHQSQEGIFPGSSLWEHGMFLEVEPIKVWGPSEMVAPSWDCFCHATIYSDSIRLLKITIKCSHQFMVLVAPAANKQFCLWLCMWPSLYFSVAVLPPQFSACFRSYWYLDCPPFVVVKAGLITYELFPPWSWNQKSELTVKGCVSESFEEDSMREYK